MSMHWSCCPVAILLCEERSSVEKRDARGNPVGCANNIPIMDLCVYCIEFDNSDVSELTANVIAELMHASCDGEGNEYLIMDLFVGHRSNAKAVCKDGQRMAHKGCNSLHLMITHPPDRRRELFFFRS